MQAHLFRPPRFTSNLLDGFSYSVDRSWRRSCFPQSFTSFYFLCQEKSFPFSSHLGLVSFHGCFSPRPKEPFLFSLLFSPTGVPFNTFHFPRQQGVSLIYRSLSLFHEMFFRGSAITRFLSGREGPFPIVGLSCWWPGFLPPSS